VLLEVGCIPRKGKVVKNKNQADVVLAFMELRILRNIKIQGQESIIILILTII
jgi:hypothetical protein